MIIFKTDMSGKIAKIISTEKKSYQDIIGCIGTIIDGKHASISVEISGHCNERSLRGLYWFRRNQVGIINKMEDNTMVTLKGYEKIAVINHLTGRNTKKNCYFALYDNDIKVGDTVVATGASKGELLRVKEILPADIAIRRSGIKPTAEIIARVDIEAYERRIAERKKASDDMKALEKKDKEARIRNKYLDTVNFAYATMLEELIGLESA